MAAALLVGSAVATPQIADATGWPAGYQGVMLQGFYWDSYEATSWAKLEKSADELSKYFKLIWIPNSAKAEVHRPWVITLCIGSPTIIHRSAQKPSFAP